MAAWRGAPSLAGVAPPESGGGDERSLGRSPSKPSGGPRGASSGRPRAVRRGGAEIGSVLTGVAARWISAATWLAGLESIAGAGESAL